ncbi:MAG: DUF1475 family protein [Anaerolineaceae bacterium]|nr:DUF1475 family protein [Anaerolineaceae bacterium]
MKWVKWISAVGVLAMAGIILYAFIIGNFSAEGNILLAMPWGKVSMVDLYVGFTLFSLWIGFREKYWLSTLIWVFFMMTLGFFTGALYVFVTASTSDGNWGRFFLGKRYADLIKSEGS